MNLIEWWIEYVTLHYGKNRFKNRKNLDSYCKKVYPNLGQLEWSAVDFCLQITFGILFFIVRAIENPKNPKKVHPSIFDFSLMRNSIFALQPWSTNRQF